MIKITVTGDFCPIGKIGELSLLKKNKDIFHDFLPVLNESDLSITNLECPLINSADAGIKFGPVLRADVSTIDLLKYANISLVTLANNHIMDYGNEGLDNTIKLCEEKQIAYVGAGRTLKEARIPFTKVIKGKKITIFNFAENEFSNTHGDYPGANPLSLASNFNDIKKFKDDSDYIIVILHGGNEMYQLPSPRFKETLRFFADCGANAVIAHHTHCFSGFETYNGSSIFYGLGNFLFDYNIRNNDLWNTGLAVQLILSDTNSSFELIPFYQNKNTRDGIFLMNENEKKIFNEQIEKLNCIIQDDKLLEREFLKFVESKKNLYSHYLEPYTQKILHGLYSRKIIPSFLNAKKRLLYLNLIRCESHRDIILKILEG